MNDFLNRYDKMQRLNNRQFFEDDQYSRDIKGYLSLICSAIVLIFVTMIYVKSCETTPQPVIVSCNTSRCHISSTKMGLYFKKNGSKNPEEMAVAVSKTKSPRLLAAIAVVETGGNSHIRKGGYKKRHDGAFQVSSKHWGAVPHDAAGQALQAERILTELIVDKKNIKVALNYYGGDTHGKYANSILKELQEVPR
jgi:hypothetical protein